MDDNKKIGVLIYGDEAIDTHLLIDSESPEIVLNDKLNGQSVRMLTDRTGHKLIGKLIQKIGEKFYSDKTDNVGIGYICSCDEKANYAYYTWRRVDSNSDKEEYYKDQFIGAKFDWINDENKKLLKKDFEEYDEQKEKNIDILIFYNRHYEGEGCEQCRSYKGNNNIRSCIYNSKYISELLKTQEKAPVIFIRTAGENCINSKSDPSNEIINIIKENSKLYMNTIVLTKLNDLKGLGAELPVKYSWEDLIRSTYKELKRIRRDKNNLKNGLLVSAPLIIVDFDYDGYAAFDFSSSDDRCTVVYNKGNINGEGFKKISKKGSVPSSTSILQAIIANFKINKLLEPDMFKNNISTILKVCYLSIYYYCSMGREFQSKSSTFQIDLDSLTSFIHDAYISCTTENETHINISQDNKIFIEQHMPGFITLDDSFFDENSECSFSDVIIKDFHRYSNVYGLCKKIVEDGLVQTELPYVCFGKLLSIDIEEIKNYRHIYHLMQNKILNPLKDRKPLSFCVFGKPGAGKSFGVKQIARSITNTENTFLTFNLSQMNSVEDLYNAFVKISDFVLENKVPIVFWDEFDSPFEGKKYGWLKYFLAPMEDGEYFHNNVSHNVGSCVFIFAGSNVESWKDFVKLSDVNKKIKDADLSKISDFISRILGYIDVKGPNQEAGLSGDSDKEAFKLRRAIFIRQNIETIYGIDKNERFSIDPDMLKAMINVNKYKHGNRSLSNLIKQFRINSGNAKHIKKYCIPNQLELYVDEQDWNRLIGSGSTQIKP